MPIFQIEGVEKNSLFSCKKEKKTGIGELVKKKFITMMNKATKFTIKKRKLINAPQKKQRIGTAIVRLRFHL
ncbi:hypothetical protein P620_14695 (plasmid) [Lactococcus lactis subsp. lactis KLDS 4.0325]|nr:hypothetical protein P620_14695 [Lactococcus lactis subsp. lactis KLDS 4.0325]